MSPMHAGACLCGEVKIIIDADPIAVLSCFCQHCSKGAGAPNQVIAKFPFEKVTVTSTDESLGTYTFHDTSSASPKEKTFCLSCGTPLWTVPEAARGKYLIIRTAILDTGATLHPQSEIFVKNRPAWMKSVEGASQWDEARK